MYTLPKFQTGRHGLTGTVKPSNSRMSLTAACSIILLLFAIHPSTGIAQESPRELRSAAWTAMAKGAFEAAIPPLQQLVDYFGDSDDPRVASEMQSVYFNLGLCFFLTGQFEQSGPVFETYLKRYPHTVRSKEAAVFLADGHRFSQNLKRAVRKYDDVLKSYRLSPDWKADVLVSKIRCALAAEDWAAALPILEQVRVSAPDSQRRNWAATLLVTAYLKESRLDKVYALAPYLLHPFSFAARSVAYNMSALETAEFLFAEEKYRDALWVYRLVYPYDQIKKRSQQHLQQLERSAEYLREQKGKYRELLRAQENIAEIEAELKALEEIDSYDEELVDRTARAYMEVRRYREAGDLYFHRFETTDGEAADEALYLSFHCYTQIAPWDRAFGLGRLYMDEYSDGGEFYDPVSLAVGQMHAQLKHWPQVISVLTEALKASPQHESVAECMFLIGYASFMEENFADTVGWLRRMNNEYPGNDRMEEGTYWTGMALLFDSKYEDARDVFTFFLADFPKSPFVTDAEFRRAVCDYGLSEWTLAERRLQAFVANYPDSQLTGEALMMLADIAGTDGRLKRAVAFYQQALEHDLNIEPYNYCSFRRGEMLFEMNSYPELVQHFQNYLARDREGSNRPQALYWIVKGLWQQDEKQGALDYLLDGVATHGSERHALGIDLLLNEWIGLSKQMSPEESEEAWQRLLALKEKAESEGKSSLALRLERLFIYRPNETENKKQARIDRLLQEHLVPDAPPGVLELMMDLGMKQDRKQVASKAAMELIENFTETDYALSARMFIAERAIEQEDYDTAIEHLNVIRRVFAASGEAAQALLHLGNIYMQQRQYDKADEAFTEILSVRQWSGPLWPAALYGRGECARRQMDYREATAFYERIYVLYLHYGDWAAKAYLRRAECLVRMKQYVKAEETLQEMLNIQRLADSSEGEEAKKLLDMINRRI